MKATVRVTVEEDGRTVRVSAVVSGESGYGKDPIIGGTEKALDGARKLVDTSIRSLRGTSS